MARFELYEPGIDVALFAVTSCGRRINTPNDWEDAVSSLMVLLWRVEDMNTEQIKRNWPVTEDVLCMAVRAGVSVKKAANISLGTNYS